jgi:phosphoribosylamine--glycine ligase
MEGNTIVTAGLYGWTAVVTGTGQTIGEARASAYDRAARIRVPNVRYRLDIGDKLLAREFAALEQWGWL